MMEINDDAINKVALDLIGTIKKVYDTFRKSSDYKEEYYLLEGLDELIEDIDKKGEMLVGEEVRLKSYQYWNDIMREKIETINAIGGKYLMVLVHCKLDELSDSQYNYAAAFNSLSNGIGGWYI